MITLVPQFNTWRMVQEYTQRYYLPRPGESGVVIRWRFARVADQK